MPPVIYRWCFSFFRWWRGEQRCPSSAWMTDDTTTPLPPPGHLRAEHTNRPCAGPSTAHCHFLSLFCSSPFSLRLRCHLPPPPVCPAPACPTHPALPAPPAPSDLHCLSEDRGSVRGPPTATVIGEWGRMHSLPPLVVVVGRFGRNRRHWNGEWSVIIVIIITGHRFREAGESSFLFLPSFLPVPVLLPSLPKAQARQ